MRGIAKVINGEIQIFATEGEANEGAPVYVFETKEEFDAAIEAGEIPVGAIIIKTYDGIEMAGGPFDGELSLESENAVQNLVVTAAINRMQELLDEVKNLKATLDGFGMAKIAPVSLTDVTEDNGMVLGAFEKNASIEGTIANLIKKQGENLETISFKNLAHGGFFGNGQHSLKLNSGDLYMIHIILIPAALYTGFFGFASIRDGSQNVSLAPVFPKLDDGGLSITANGDTITFNCAWGYKIDYWKLDSFS